MIYYISSSSYQYGIAHKYSLYINIKLNNIVPYCAIAGDVTCSSWPSQPCCAADMANSLFKLNSRFICECWGGSWDPVTDFRSLNKMILLRSGYIILRVCIFVIQIR